MQNDKQAYYDLSTQLIFICRIVTGIFNNRSKQYNISLHKHIHEQYNSIRYKKEQTC